jgi:hypothetical protein
MWITTHIKLEELKLAILDEQINVRVILTMYHTAMQFQ